MPGSPHVSERYVAWVSRHRRPLGAAWLVYIVVAAVFAPRLMDNTSAVLRPPAGSDAAVADARYAAAFPGVDIQSNAVVYAVTPRASVLTPAFEALTLRLNASAHAYRAGLVASFGSYYTMAALNLLPRLYTRFLSADNRTGAISIIMNCAPTDATCVGFVDFLSTQVAAEAGALADADITVTVTGLTALACTILATVEADMLRMDAIVLPIAAGMLLCLLRSGRLMLLPLVAIAFSVAGSFAGAYLLTFVGEVFSSVPSLMMSLNVALCVDYSLFLCIRYRTEIAEHGDHDRAVVRMVRYAGYNIIVSSVTLCFCSAGMLAYPIVVMRTLGLSAAIAVVATVAVNLGLTPLLLLSFEQFFVAAARADVLAACTRRRPAGDDVELSAPIVRTGGGGDREARMRRAGWYRLGTMLVRPSVGALALLAVAGVVAPVARYAFNDKLVDDLTLNLPRGAAASAAYVDMTSTFGYGSVYPYRLLLTPNASTPVASAAFFDAACAGVQSLIATVPDVHVDDFMSVFIIDGECVDFSFLALCRVPEIYAAETAACNTLFYAWGTLVSPGGASVVVELTLDWDPVGVNGPGWLRAMRAELVGLSARTGIAVSMTGHAADGIDTFTSVVGAFPSIVVATAAVVLVFTGLAFKSVLIPVRSVFTIALTILFVWGLADITYQQGYFNATGFGGLQGAGAIQWLAYVCDFSIVVGLALDYDCYVTVAIIEAREAGYTSKEAVVRGLYHTGYVITAAGTIMALAFFGLLLSSIPGVNMIGFYLVIAVLFDTFVVRAVVVPAVMGLLGDANWWPGVKAAPEAPGPLCPRD